jgi:ribonuclease R
MEKLREKVVTMLRESAGRPLKMKEIARRLEIGEESRRKLRTAVKDLVEAGEIVQTRGKRFGALEHMNLVAGIFLGHPDGYGFVQLLPRPGQADLPDIFVSGRDVGGAMHGDRVVVRVAGSVRPSRLPKAKSQGRPQKAKKTKGEIIRVLERAHSSIVGYYEKGRNFGFVVPIDARISQDLYVSFDDSLGAEQGQIVSADITEYASHHRNPEGKVTEILGNRGDRGLDTELLIRKHGLSAEFPPGVLKAAEKLSRKIPKAEIKRRIDLRDLPMATIDGADAKDFDDAVSIEMTEKGNYLLGVHIADVSYYVTPGSTLDDEAYARATSIYLEDKVLPMLPERISNNLCSLREKEDRLAMTVKMEIEPKGSLVGYDIFESVICVNHRMTYDDVYAILEKDKALSKQYSDFVDDFRTMNKLARMLRAKRIAHGSLDFSFPEARAIFDGEGEVIDIILQKHTLAHELIEEFMLLANDTVARHVTDRQAPMMYRIHETPDPDKIAAFREFVASVGYQLSEKGATTPQGLQKLSRQIKDKPEEPLVNYLMLRSLKMACYSTENLGHFGLAFDCYTHFTSPIRRYPDLIVHRILRALSDGGAGGVRDEYSEHLDRIAEHCSAQEREAMEAERESLQTKQMMFMSDKIGDEFAGRITGVHSYGLFVELVDFLAEGLIHVSSLEDDYYIFMEEKHCLLGENSGKSFRLGDEIRVQVVRVDLDRRRMDFVPAEDKPPARRRGRRRKR